MPFLPAATLQPAAQALAQEHQALLVTLDQMETDMQRWLQSQQEN